MRNVVFFQRGDDAFNVKDFSRHRLARTYRTNLWKDLPDPDPLVVYLGQRLADQAAAAVAETGAHTVPPHPCRPYERTIRTHLPATEKIRRRAERT